MTTSSTRPVSGRRWLLTSESVAQGHPDKVCDLISDAILDACLQQDDASHVAVETLCKGKLVVLAGEVTTSAAADFRLVAREAIRQAGYTRPDLGFWADGVYVLSEISEQSPEIRKSVRDTARAARRAKPQGAGDQGLMFGYATDETPELMPLPILLAHRLTRALAEDREAGRVAWLRPDAKSQVSVEYAEHTPVRVTRVVVSTQHEPGVRRPAIQDYVIGNLGPRALGDWCPAASAFLVNPSGSFVLGGPVADCGVTGRKIIADSYGGAARHGGGAFSGKDPSKVDRSACYFARYVARQVVKRGLARRVELQVSYAIDRAEPMSLMVETFGTGDDGAVLDFVRRSFDFAPAAMIDRLKLRRPIYRSTTNYGHFGRPGLPWEA